jgi:hypothetical protein
LWLFWPASAHWSTGGHVGAVTVTGTLPTSVGRRATRRAAAAEWDVQEGAEAANDDKPYEGLSRSTQVAQ